MSLYRQIFPNGSLSVHRLTEGDQGEYSCGVQNMHGKDQIVYDVVVQGLSVKGCQSPGKMGTGNLGCDSKALNFASEYASENASESQFATSICIKSSFLVEFH